MTSCHPDPKTHSKTKKGTRNPFHIGGLGVFCGSVSLTGFSNHSKTLNLLKSLHRFRRLFGFRVGSGGVVGKGGSREPVL